MTELGSISEFDALLFHYIDTVNHPELPNQQQRRPHQRYIMFYLESIENNKKYLKKRNFVLRFRLQSPPA